MRMVLGIFGAQQLPAQFEDVLVARRRLRVFALAAIQCGEIVHGPERIRMRFAERRPLILVELGPYLFGSRELAFVAVGKSQTVQRRDCLRMMHTERFLTKFHGLERVLASLRDQSEIKIRVRNGVFERSANCRCIVKFAGKRRGRPVEDGADGEVGIGGLCRTGLRAGTGLRQKIVLKETGNCAGGGCFAVRPGFLL